MMWFSVLFWKSFLENIVKEQLDSGAFEVNYLYIRFKKIKYLPRPQYEFNQKVDKQFGCFLF